MESHEGKVFLWNGYWVVHMETGEMHALDFTSAPFTLHFNESGRAFVHATSSQWVSSILTHHIVKKEGGDFVGSFSSDSDRTKYNLMLPIDDAKKHLFGVKEVAFHVLNMPERTFTVQSYLLPHDGAMCFIDLKAFHTNNSIKASKFFSTWVRSSWSTWKTWLRKLGLPESHYREATRSKTLHGNIAEDNLFGNESLSVHAFLALLFRWSAGGRKGFQDKDDQETARQCTTLVLAVVSRCRPVLKLFYSMSKVEWNPPLFWGVGGHTCCVEVQSGELCVDALPQSTRQLVQRHLQRHSTKVHLSDLLCLISQENDQQWLFFQFLVQVGVIVQDEFIKLVWIAGAPAVSTKWSMEKQLVRYMVAARQTFTKSSSLLVALDGSRIGKKKMLLGAMACSDERIAAVLPPQVIANFSTCVVVSEPSSKIELECIFLAFLVISCMVRLKLAVRKLGSKTVPSGG